MGQAPGPERNLWSREDREISVELEAAADQLLAELAPDPECPVLGRRQLTYRRQRETFFCEDLAVDPGDTLTPVDERAAVTELLNRAKSLTSTERAILLLAEYHGFQEAELEWLFGVSYRTVRREKSRAVLKVRTAARS